METAPCFMSSYKPVRAVHGDDAILSIPYSSRRWLLGLLLSGSCSVAAATTLNLDLEGVSGELADNVRGFLSIQTLHNQTVRSENRLRYLHRQAEREIRLALEPFGYYNPELELQLTQAADGRWQARYRIDPGPRTRIQRADLVLEGEGNTDSEFRTLMRQTPVRKGAWLSHQDYERLKSQLQSLASERGYYRAHFTRQRILVDPFANEAEIELTYATGERTRISELRFSDSPIGEPLLRRYPRFAEGDYLAVADLIDLQGALIDSDYFADVEVRPLLDELEAGEVPVQVTLTPRPRTRYQAGFGYGTDTGARMQLGLNRRYVNSRGHKLDSRLRLSEVRNDITGAYMIPGQQPRFDQYGLRARYSQEDTKVIESETFAVGGLWQKQLGDWERVLSLDVEQEKFTFDGTTTQVRLLIPRAQLSRTVFDDRFDTRDGYRISTSVAAASESLLSDVSLVQLGLSGKRVDAMGDNWRLLTRAEVGALVTDQFDQVPASLRFYAGGDTSVRGYDYQTLGPTSPRGNVIGGKYLLTGSVEADYMFRPNWRMAVFADAGNAFNTWGDGLKTSVGAGVRWQSPVGPVRLDLATPLQDSGFRIHFTLGPDL